MDNGTGEAANSSVDNGTGEAANSSVDNGTGDQTHRLALIRARGRPNAAGSYLTLSNAI